MVSLPITSHEPGALLKHRLLDGNTIKSSDIEIYTEFDNLKHAESSDSTVHVKTLVWEIHALDTKLHIVTAQKMSDRVDISLLQDIIYNDKQLMSSFGHKHTLEQPSHISISLAPTEKAESMTGFKLYATHWAYNTNEIICGEIDCGVWYCKCRKWNIGLQFQFTNETTLECCK